MFDAELVTLKDPLEWRKELAVAEKVLAEEKAAAAATAAAAAPAAAAKAEAEKAATAKAEKDTPAKAEKDAAAKAEKAAAAKAEKAPAAATAASNQMTTHLQSAKAKAATDLGPPSEKEESPPSKHSSDPSFEASAMKVQKLLAEEPKLEIEVFDLPLLFGWAQRTDGGALLWEGDQCNCECQLVE
jgi:hypothetical protein